MTKRLLFLPLMVLSLWCSQPARAQFYSLTSNLAGDVTLNLNLEFSATINRNWSIHFPLVINPFVYTSDLQENRKMQNLTFSPALRYWKSESYRGAFLGPELLFSRYHISNLILKNRYDGYAVGAGLSFGYAYPLSRRWNFEWEAGVGVAYCWYDEYICKKCGIKLGENQHRIIPTLTRLNLQFVYLF